MSAFFCYSAWFGVSITVKLVFWFEATGALARCPNPRLSEALNFKLEYLGYFLSLRELRPLKLTVVNLSFH